VLSDTAEYGCYLFDHALSPLLEYVKMQTNLVTSFNNDSNGVDNKELIEVNGLIRNHPVEKLELG
jgi:ketol-acid reductoisomerase